MLQEGCTIPSKSRFLKCHGRNMTIFPLIIYGPHTVLVSVDGSLKFDCVGFHFSVDLRVMCIYSVTNFFKIKSKLCGKKLTNLE